MVVHQQICCETYRDEVLRDRRSLTEDGGSRSDSDEGKLHRNVEKVGGWIELG
jgi:hypothetical protein